MQAAQQDEPNGLLSLRELPVPTPQAGQVLVRMSAAPINPSDLGSLRGFSYSGERKYPFTPGLEGSGTVVAAGEGFLPSFLNGKRVACSAPTNGNGTWAEYMVTSAKLCVPLTRNVSLEQGSMLLVNPLSALAMIEIAQREKHPAIVSTAAASALGGMILRLGKRANLPVIHVVRREEQAALVRARGGEIVLSSSKEDFNERLRAMAQQLKATLFIDAISGEMTGQLAEAAPYGSTIVLIARLSQQESQFDARTALTKHLHIRGWFLSNWLREKNLLQALQLTQQSQSLLDTVLQSPIHKRLPLSAAQEGVDTYSHDMTAGKILLIADLQ